MTNDILLKPTRILDYNASTIRDLVDAHGWRDLPQGNRIGAVYDFVRNEILFGYNRSDSISASEVLADGYGQCNTKGTLLMALLRSVGIRCRIHGFTIHKALQRGVVPELLYPIAPDEILHSWIEVETARGWKTLEGFILDRGYLESLQSRFAGTESLCGYGVGTESLSAPPVQWIGNDTFIQKSGIVADLGTFDSPDTFHEEHDQNFGPMRGVFYRHVVRHWMNVRVRAIRSGRVPTFRGKTSHALRKPVQTT